jgi:hypothetical protein
MRDDSRRTNTTCAARGTGVATDADPVTFREKSPSRRHLARCPGASPNRHAPDSLHRTACAAGADPLTLDAAVSDCIRNQPAGPTTGPPAPGRSRSARSSSGRTRRLSPAHPPVFTLRRPTTRRPPSDEELEPASCRLRTACEGGARATEPTRSSVAQRCCSVSSPLAKRPRPTFPPAAPARSVRPGRGWNAPPRIELAAWVRGPKAKSFGDRASRRSVGVRRTVLRVVPATKAP